MADPTYATVEQVQAAADYKPTAYEADRLYRIVDAASRRIEQQLHRHFYPLTEAVTPWVLPRWWRGFYIESSVTLVNCV